MQQEAQPIIDKFNLNGHNHKNEINVMMDPMKIFSNQYQSIFVICNGNSKYFNVTRISTQAAAINAFLTILYIKPDLIISVGISGAIIHKINDVDINIGDVFIAEKIMYHDRRIKVHPWSEGWHIGMYQTTKLDINFNLIDELRNELVIVSTGNAFPEAKDDHKMWKIYGSHLTEMEAAAIAEVCLEKGVDFTAIKGVSNFVHGSEGVTEFESHLILSVDKLGKVTSAVITALLG